MRFNSWLIASFVTTLLLFPIAGCQPSATEQDEGSATEQDAGEAQNDSSSTGVDVEVGDGVGVDVDLPSSDGGEEGDGVQVEVGGEGIDLEVGPTKDPTE